MHGPTRTFRANLTPASLPARGAGPERGGRAGGGGLRADVLRPFGQGSAARCRFVPPLIHFTPESLTYSVPLYLKQQRDRTLVGLAYRAAEGPAAAAAALLTCEFIGSHARPNAGIPLDASAGAPLAHLPQP
jgi:hypothetical protein